MTETDVPADDTTATETLPILSSGDAPPSAEVLAALPDKVRVHALARVVGLSSRELLAVLARLGITARSAQSTLGRDTVAGVVDEVFGTGTDATSETSTAADADPTTPVGPVVGAAGTASSPAAAPVGSPMFLAPGTSGPGDGADAESEAGAAPAPAGRSRRRRSRSSGVVTPSDGEPSTDGTPDGPNSSGRSAGTQDRTGTESDATSTDVTGTDSTGTDRTGSDSTGSDSTGSDGSDEADSGEDDGGRRRRRRGRRGRGRGRGTDEASDGSEDSDGSDGSDGSGNARGGRGTDDSGDDDADGSGDSDEGDDATDADGSGDDSSPGSRRRRRRRRRSSDNSDSADTGDDTADGDDPPNTVTHVRDRVERPDPGKSDEVKGVKGSTRLEAKRQRRRDGRDAGRRRPAILSESEFLARREAVERTMVVRQQADRSQIGVLEDGVLVEHFVAGEGQHSMVGNVYLGRVQNVLPSMEAAFVDIGRGRNAVLYAGEVNWDASGLEGKQRKIEQALSSGDQVLVQVTKDPVGHKGARLTTQISLPGRFLVFVPAGGATGISRKLPENERKRLKEVLKRIVPDESGVIIRTAAEGVAEDDLEQDVRRLTAQWEVIERRATEARNAKGTSPTLVYEEPDLLIRVVRDMFNEDFSSLVISGDRAWETLEGYISHVAPELAPRLTRHVGPRDVFGEYRIDEAIVKALDRKVWLPSGGTLVIDRTEAMTVIDVNTGKFTGSGGNLEETVTRNNLEAAEEIVRQLRVRDIGGMIVIDFIDMVLESNRDLVLRRLTECLGRDRTRHQVSEVTSLGLVQMTRKRVGQGLLDEFSTTCEHCRGRGVMVSTEPIMSSDHAHRSGNGHADGSRSGEGSAHGGSSGNGGSSGHGGGNGDGGHGNGGSSNGSGRRRGRGRRSASAEGGSPTTDASSPVTTLAADDEERRRSSAAAVAAMATSSGLSAGNDESNDVTTDDTTDDTDATVTAGEVAGAAGVTGAVEAGEAAGAIEPDVAFDTDLEPVSEPAPPSEPVAVAAVPAVSEPPARPRRRRAASRPAGPPVGGSDTDAESTASAASAGGS